nr:hypothetical protein [Pandoravirus aubagnensis]
MERKACATSKWQEKKKKVCARWLPGHRARVQETTLLAAAAAEAAATKEGCPLGRRQKRGHDLGKKERGAAQRQRAAHARAHTHPYRERERLCWHPRPLPPLLPFFSFLLFFPTSGGYARAARCHDRLPTLWACVARPLCFFLLIPYVHSKRAIRRRERERAHAHDPAGVVIIVIV